MTLARACELAADLSDLDLVRLRERTGALLRERGFVVDQSPLPIASELDEDERPKVADQWGWEAE